MYLCKKVKNVLNDLQNQINFCIGCFQTTMLYDCIKYSFISTWIKNTTCNKLLEIIVDVYIHDFKIL